MDSEGEVLDILVQPRRDCNAALKLMPGRCVGGRCEIIRLDPMLLNPLITNRNRRALGDEWRDGYRVVTPAAMDAWGHHHRAPSRGGHRSCPAPTLCRRCRGRSPSRSAGRSLQSEWHLYHAHGTNFASSETGVSRLTQSTPLCIASLTFMGDLRCWSWVHSMKCSAPVPRYSLYNGSAPPVCLGCPADARSPESVSKFR